MEKSSFLSSLRLMIRGFALGGAGISTLIFCFILVALLKSQQLETNQFNMISVSRPDGETDLITIIFSVLLLITIIYIPANVLDTLLKGEIKGNPIGIRGLHLFALIGIIFTLINSPVTTNLFLTITLLGGLVYYLWAILEKLNVVKRNQLPPMRHPLPESIKTKHIGEPKVTQKSPQQKMSELRASHTLEDDIAVIKIYCQYLAQEWWKSNDSENAICEGCNGQISRDDGVLIGQNLYCVDCANEKFGPSYTNYFRTDPNFYGHGILEKAWDFVTQYSAKMKEI